MTQLLEIGLLVEQSSIMDTIQRSIVERIPMSIYYKGPEGEVRSGQRLDIEPIVLGSHAKTDNLVIWAYVFKGVSKRGLPGWKMFRVDRINSAKLNPSGNRFNLEDLPGYEKGKAPDMMKSLSNVQVFSPYWFDEDEPYEVPEPQDVPVQTEPGQEPLKPETPIAKPETPNDPPRALANKVYNELLPQIRDVDGRRVISKQDYETALSNLTGYQRDQFNVHQRMIGGNQRPGEGTRQRFQDTSKFELDRILAQDGVEVDNGADTVVNQNEVLAEGHRIQNRIKRLIKW